MGLAIKDLLTTKEISLDDIRGKTIAIDTFNLLYQFITTIRSRDGSPLMDSKGDVTSHLVGLFSRTTKLMEYDIKMIFVFDGDPPDLKQKERERRKDAKKQAEEKYKIALEKKDIDEMKKYASRTSRLTPEMIKEAKELISALGHPIVQAPSEGEAQAAHIVKKQDADYCVSQDFDSLIHGCLNLLRNLSILGKRKKASKLSYETVKPEILNLSENLNNLGIDNDQLIALAILVGTDYNPGGIKGIGPKNALKLVKQYKSDFDTLFKQARWNFDFPWTDVFYTIKNMEVTDKYDLEFKPIDIEKLKKILIEKHDFSEERINKTLSKINKSNKQKQQKGLGEFF